MSARRCLSTLWSTALALSCVRCADLPSPLSPPGPAALYLPGLSYDEQRGVLVLSGGGTLEDWSATHNSTWEWDTHEWSLRSADGIGDRNGQAVVYDRARSVSFLFGGAPCPTEPDELYCADQFAWDGSRWMKVPAQGYGPGPRFGHAMAYDSKRGRTLLYGGPPSTMDCSTGDCQATWSFDGVAWQRAD